MCRVGFVVTYGHGLSLERLCQKGGIVAGPDTRHGGELEKSR